MKTILLNAIARALFVSAWADWKDEHGSGCPAQVDVMDIAPETPDFMKGHAEKVLAGWLKINNLTLEQLEAKTLETWQGVGDEEEMFRIRGHYLAMEGLGHGVSWEDDHNEMNLKTFHYEFSYYEIPFDICPVNETEEKEA